MPPLQSSVKHNASVVTTGNSMSAQSVSREGSMVSGFLHAHILSVTLLTRRNLTENYCCLFECRSIANEKHVEPRAF
jgi:hypothetical protein